MKIPSKVKVGRVQYSVLLRPDIGAHRYGVIYYGAQVVKVATHHNGKPRKQAAVNETFWHEMTHAVLHDMGDPLHKDEAFVTGFSSRLSKMIDSAKFKE